MQSNYNIKHYLLSYFLTLLVTSMFRHSNIILRGIHYAAICLYSGEFLSVPWTAKVHNKTGKITKVNLRSNFEQKLPPKDGQLNDFFFFKFTNDCL
jgi:hypothetical protein